MQFGWRRGSTGELVAGWDREIFGEHHCVECPVRQPVTLNLPCR